MEALDQLNDMIEELTKKADAQDETDKMKVDLEMQIERATKDVELSITNHLNRSCPSEVSRSAKERLFKEQERDIINPMETIKKLFMDLMKMTKDKKTREDLSGQEENWMDKTTKGIMTISDRYTNIPEIDKGGEDLDATCVSAQGTSSKAILRVKKAEPPKFDGKIISFPRFKKVFKSLMQDYDDPSQVYYIRNSLIYEDKNLIKTLDTMKEVWAALDKRY